LDLSLDTRAFADFNFPFPFVISISYSLKDNLLITSLNLRNIGLNPMPAGFGLHPYFQRHLAGSSEVLLSFKAQGLYEVDDQMIPTGQVAKPTQEYDFREARAVHTHLNHLYRDYSNVRLHWPKVASLEISAEPIFKHLVVFTHADGSLAVEPVSNATNGFNLMASGFEGHGVRVLAPGESLAGSVFFKLSL
jgi:aldose 1-epimerase